MTLVQMRRRIELHARHCCTTCKVKLDKNRNCYVLTFPDGQVVECGTDGPGVKAAFDVIREYAAS